MLSLLLVLSLGPSGFPSLDELMSRHGYGFVRSDEFEGVRNLTYQPPILPLNDPNAVLGEAVVSLRENGSPQAKRFPVRGDALDDQDGRFSAPGDVGYKRSTPSGMPLGTDAWITTVNGPRKVKIRFRTPWMRGDVNILSDKGFPADPEGLVESLARLVVGESEARRLERAADVSLGSGSIRVWRSDDLTFADLGAWAGLRGWTAKRDDDRCVLTLTKDEHTIVAPMGAPKVQVDGAWKDLPDVIVLKEGKWWVPLDALEAAIKP